MITYYLIKRDKEKIIVSKVYLNAKDIILRVINLHDSIQHIRTGREKDLKEAEEKYKKIIKFYSDGLKQLQRELKGGFGRNDV